MADQGAPLAQVYRAYEQLEGRVSSALEQLVATNGFADLLAMSATNTLAITKITNDLVDQLVRATRLAVRRDVLDLARQLARTEDKLERLLQVMEQVQTRLDELAPLLTATPASQDDVRPAGPAPSRSSPRASSTVRTGRAAATRAQAGAGGRRRGSS